MTTRRILFSTLPLFMILGLTAHRLVSEGSRSIGQYQQVKEVRVSDTISEYTYRATLSNNGTPLRGATATATTRSLATTIIDGSLTFGPVATGSSVVSSDTFVFRQDRRVPFDFSNLQWTIQSVNRSPVANAGPDQTVSAGAVVTLNGSGSTDGDGDPLTYSWSVVSRPTASFATLDNPTDVRPSFKADAPGSYVIQLVVSDGYDSASDTVTVSTTNSRPVANAGSDQTTAVGQTVRLDGSRSSDADGYLLQFVWSFVSRPTGSSAVLANLNTVAPTFVADRSGSYVVQLVVSDGTVASNADTVTISTTNTAPVADAGADQTVTTGSVVSLNGSRSTDADGDALTFVWSFISRPADSHAAVSDTTAVLPTFVADKAGTYVLQLIVRDGSAASSPDTVTIATRNSAPVANAGTAQTAAIGALVLLDGSTSYDVDGDQLSFSWSLTSQPAGSITKISGELTPRPSLVIDRAGTYVAQLIVSDGTTKSSPATVAISTRNSPPLARAGEDQLGAEVGDLVTLTGDLSGDPDGDPLTYSWSFTTRPAGSGALLDATGISRPSFTPDVPGDYVLQLVVNDGVLSSAPDTVLVHAEISVDRVSVVATDPNASETGLDPGTFTFTRSGPDIQKTKPQVVTYTVSGTATNGVDYTPMLTGSITIPAGQLSATLTITPVDDGLIEGDETVIVTVKTGQGTSSATITITDNDLPAVTIAATDAAASETGPDPGTFTVTRTGPTTAALAVSYTVGGTASNGTDYTPTLTGTLTIPVGQASAAITITPVDDSEIEGDETVILTLTANSAYTVGAANSATVTISDNDLPAVTIAASDPNASEAGPDTGTFTVTRNGPTASALTVSYTVGGTASASDYTPALTGSVTIPSGQASTNLTITPTADNLVESPETVILTLQAAAGYTIGSPNSGTVTIADDPPVVNLNASDPDAAEANADPGSFTFTRSGGDLNNALTVNYTIGGTATNGTDYVSIPATISIAAGTTTATRTIVPIADNLLEGPETVVLMLSNSPNYTAGGSANGTVTIADDPVVVSVVATDPNASEAGPDPGVFTFSRSGGDLASPVQISFALSGAATEGVDYVDLGPLSVTIPAGQTSQTLTVTPIVDNIIEPDETVIVTITANANYNITSSTATVTIHDATAPPLVSVTAIDSSASETGPDPGVFRFTRTGATTSALTVTYSIGGTATNGVDYQTIGTTVQIPAGQASADVTIIPIADNLSEPTETVVLTVVDDVPYDVGSPASATVNIADAQANACGPEGGPMTNGATHCGAISNPGEVDTWTFTANQGDRIAVSIGEVIDNNDFAPWIRVLSPTGATLANTSGTVAAQAGDIVAPSTGTYQILVASFDSGFNGTGTYLLTMAHTPGPITTSAGDEGGALINGATHTGSIYQGDMDAWTFTANAGDRIAVNIGEITDAGGFAPWIRVWAPNGASLGSSSGPAATQLTDMVAPVPGTYLVLVASFNTGFSGSGTYRLTMTHTPGPITISPGDDGGPMTNGAMHTGTIDQGDLDVWTFDANAGDRIAVNIGEITDTSGDFAPWIRVWAPNGTALGNSSGAAATQLSDMVAPVTGTYLVLVASFDTTYNGTGTYRLTMTHTPGPITVSNGDQGGPLDNGALHTGEILPGDLDVWTFTANQGDRIAVNIGEIVDNNTFSPWIRVWAPNGASLGSSSGASATQLSDMIAPVTGTYLVLVSSFDSGYDGSGTYGLTMTHTPGPITVSSGDQGGPLDNGGMQTGEIIRGDLDVWTFTANQGDRIGVEIGEITDTSGDFSPWIRVWAPNGQSLGSASGASAALLTDMIAPATGNYLVLVSSFDSGYDGTGTYRLSMVHTPGPITVAAGDQGGPMVNGATETGEILPGDTDVWTFTANAGERIGVNIGELVDNGAFAPWIRVWAPNGASLGSSSGAVATQISDMIAPVTGTYLVLVSSFNSGYNGTGTYQLTVAHTAAPVSISPGDEGGPLPLSSPQPGTITAGDLDVWTFTANAGEKYTVQINEVTAVNGFQPWIRVWTPAGGTLGSASGLTTASLTNFTVPVSGTYLILVGSFDSGYDGEGTYNLTLTRTQ